MENAAASQLLYAQIIGNILMMAEIAIKVCGVVFESFWSKAVVFKDARLDEVSQKCLEAYASYGIRPSQIAVKRGDQTFNYDLSFSLFNGNGTFRISAEKLEVSLQNATTDTDVEIMQDCLAKIYEHVPLPEINNTSISANAHAMFVSDEMKQQYFFKYADSAKQIASGGTIAYVNCQNWSEEIRIMIDKSLVYPGGLFLVWSTMCHGNKISRDVLTKVKQAFEESARKLDLTPVKPNGK